MTFSFIVNLRAETTRTDVSALWAPAGWLLSPDYATAGLRRFALREAAHRRTVVVDNGNYSRIAAASAILNSQSAAPRDVVLPAIRHEAGSAVAAEPAQRAFQLQNGATKLIGAEEIAPAIAAAMGRSDLFAAADLRVLNERVARRARRQIGQVQGATYLAVACAQNYRTAYTAGRVFAQAGLAGAALGLGALMNNRRDTDRTDAFGQHRPLPRPLPLRYVRSGEVICGFFEGYRQTHGGPPADFHFLGLGAPVMLALAGLFGHGVKCLTADATSPIRDAISGAVYISDPTLLKVETSREAQRLVRYKTAVWRCSCPFCEVYLARHPFDLAAARGWFENTGRDVADSDLFRGGALHDLMPLLASLSGPLAAETRRTRIGHNHVVLDRVGRKITRLRDRKSVQSWVENVVDQYKRRARLDKYGEAVDLVFSWATH